LSYYIVLNIFTPYHFAFLQCVCLFVCLFVRDDISRTTRVIFTIFCACCLWP